MLAVSPRMGLFCLALALCPLQYAKSAPTPGDQDLIRDRQDRLIQDQQRRLEELKKLPGQAAEPATPAAPAQSRCFTIQTIELKGADSLSPTERMRLIQPYLRPRGAATQRST